MIQWTYASAVLPLPDGPHTSVTEPLTSPSLAVEGPVIAPFDVIRLARRVSRCDIPVPSGDGALS